MKNIELPPEWETNVDEVLAFIKKASADHTFWSWVKNSKCKYVSLRFDMRDGAFVILDRDKNRITFDELKGQDA
jgi:hypothetical protein